MNESRYRATLPSSYYHDSSHYRRELELIWYRQWICLGSVEEWPETGDFRRLRIGNEQLIVVRAGENELCAFHNTCRHRGSILCESDSGSFNNGRIVCPYHAWSYSLTGELQNAPRTTEADGIQLADFPLYRVALKIWRGFVFVNLDSDPPPLDQALGDETENVATWPLEELRQVHRVTHQVACNWKIFWANYLECYHCPGVHPDLCDLVPVYRRGWMDRANAWFSPDPQRPHAMLGSGESCSAYKRNDSSVAVPRKERNPATSVTVVNMMDEAVAGS